jgi:hypothetical protein
MLEIIKYIEEKELEINDLKDNVNRLEDQLDKYQRYGPYAELELSPTATKVVISIYGIMTVLVLVGIMTTT